VVLGGLVSIAIIISGAALQGQSILSGADLARGLQPLYGELAGLMLSVGLFSAGITSAITAPLAAAYVVQECFGWNKDLRALRLRLVWMGILLLGVLFALIGFSPIEVIRFAQVANGLLLPFMAVFLLWMVNSAQLTATYRNTWWQNMLGLLIVILALLMGLRTLIVVFG
jgi:Mn2+/Fe2+ NRAMP family transporter